jgi:hypothetical protein
MPLGSVAHRLVYARHKRSPIPSPPSKNDTKPDRNTDKRPREGDEQQRGGDGRGRRRWTRKERHAPFERPVETQDAINLLARQLVLAVVMVVVEVVEVKGSARSVASWWRGRKSKRSQGLARKWNRAMGSVLLVGRSVGQREGRCERTQGKDRLFCWLAGWLVGWLAG